ncbi:MAG: FG-GAP repeat domain-containing protein, partial [bacterium]
DGLTDVYFGGSKHIAGEIYLQSTNHFVRSDIPAILKDSIKEDVEAVIEDFNKDGKADLFIGTGGADFFYKSKPLLDSYYASGDAGFSLTEIEGYYENTSCIKPFDFDKDGDLDLFVGNESVSKDFGKIPQSYLLVNEKGKFFPSRNNVFETLGMVTDAIWEDYDKDGQVDLIVVGEWMEPVFLKNTKGSFQRDSRLGEKLGGLWQMIVPFDIDGDGTVEYILGNWGLNSKYKASKTSPMKMYYSDFDGNDEAEPIIAIEKNDRYYPLDGFDMLASQLPNLRKKYSTYKAFAGQSIEQIFTSDQLKKSAVYEVEELGSGYLKEKNGKYAFTRFPNELQVSPILAQVKYDFDLDGKDELLLGGNYFGVQPFHGRFGSFGGAILKSNGSILKGNAVGLDLFNYSVRHLNVIMLNENPYLLVTVNNGNVQLYKILKKQK